MKSLLILKHVQVQNANAIAGLTWGFPGITNFLGFTHALSRYAEKIQGVRFDGCAVVCHSHQVQAHQPTPYGEYVFALTRNPLTKEGKTAPFNEEARMHMDVSLVIECNFITEDLDFGAASDSENTARFENELARKIPMMRLAGGTIQAIEGVEFKTLSEDYNERSKEFRKSMLRLLPGFMLVDRSPLLHEHLSSLRERQADATLLDAWLDFSAIRYRAYPQIVEGETANETTSAEWRYVAKPGEGWLVPITTGFKAISPLYPPGEVANARDPSVSFRFVESAYGVGQWISPHRLRDISHIFWRYQQDGDWYLCKNDYQLEATQLLQD